MIRRTGFRLLILVALSLIVGDAVFAQRRDFGGGGRRRQPQIVEGERNGVPLWKIPPAFKNDVFTFVRVRYNSNYRSWSWHTDYPDSELNFSSVFSSSPA